MPCQLIPKAMDGGPSLHRTQFALYSSSQWLMLGMMTYEQLLKSIAFYITQAVSSQRSGPPIEFTNYKGCLDTCIVKYHYVDAR